MNETKEDSSKWRDKLCLWIERHNIIKMSATSKSIYRFNAIPIKIKAGCRHKESKCILLTLT